MTTTKVTLTGTGTNGNAAHHASAHLGRALVHQRELAVQHGVVVAELQELGVGHFEEVGDVVVLRGLQHEGPVPGEDDEIVAVDGSRDEVTCGPGFDRVTLDRLDKLGGRFAAALRR